MRILYLSHGYPPTISGVSLVVQKLSRAMVERGHSVIVVTANDHDKPYDSVDEGVHLRRIRSLYNPFWKEGPIPFLYLNELEQIIEEERPDLIHTHENVLLSIQLIRMVKKLTVPCVTSCYFLPRYVTHYFKSNRQINNLVQGLIWKYAISVLNSYELAVFSTQSQAQEYIDHGLKIPTKIISNGVNLNRYQPLQKDDPKHLTRYQLPGGNRLLFVGRLAKDKKIDQLIRAMGQMDPELNAHLLIVGRGDDSSRLKKLTARLGLESVVHFLGFVREEDLPSIYRACLAFVIASICEVQSIPVLQAAVTGMPIIAVNAAALPELVIDGYNGYLVPPNQPQAISEAICTLIKHPELVEKFGKASLEIGQRHSESRTFQAYDKLYTQLIDSKPQSALGKRQSG